MHIYVVFISYVAVVLLYCVLLVVLFMSVDGGRVLVEDVGEMDSCYVEMERTRVEECLDSTMTHARRRPLL